MIGFGRWDILFFPTKVGEVLCFSFNGFTFFFFCLLSSGVFSAMIQWKGILIEKNVFFVRCLDAFPPLKFSILFLPFLFLVGD